MSSVKITPKKDTEHPVPYSLEDPAPASSFLEDLQIVADTAEALDALGARESEFLAGMEATPSSLRAEQDLLRSALHTGNASPLSSSLPAALGAAAFLRSYGQSLALDVVQTRTALTNKLLEIANCGETKYELKAIELLGKHSDISLFTERSEININYNNPDSLEKAIKERVKRLLNADVVDLKPLGMDLEEELGIHDADFEEVVFGTKPEAEAEGDDAPEDDEDA